MSALRKELSKVHEDLEDEKRKKKLEAATSSSAEQSKYNTDADLISPAILSPPMDTFKEKELLLQTEQLSELLSESEQTVQRLTEQEMVNIISYFFRLTTVAGFERRTAEAESRRCPRKKLEYRIFKECCFILSRK